jgi:hypothetical protein
VTLALSALLFLAQAKIDPVKVDAAIQKGVEYLKGAGSPPAHQEIANSDELLLWTFLHAGLPEDDPKFEELFKRMTSAKLERTYKVSLQAMLLEEMDRVKYQSRIQQCAQFLVDNQCKNGQWSYGEPSLYVQDVPSGGPPKKDVASGGGKAKPKEFDPSIPPHQRQKPKVVRKVSVKAMKTGPGEGDNSNSQYAALGLRACHDAGVTLPREGIQLAQKWWRDAAFDEGKGGYAGQGWSYGKKGEYGNPWGSMTAGAVGGLAIYASILGEDWKKDPFVRKGLEWMATHFTVTENPGPPAIAQKGPGTFYFYYLYAMERVGLLCGLETIGTHEWYPEGAALLLERQRSDGSWLSKNNGEEVWDTCFAILFLRRATRPLPGVASVDRLKK